MDLLKNVTITRKNFIKRALLFFSALTSASLFTPGCDQSGPDRKHTSENPYEIDDTLTQVYRVSNGDCFENISKLFELMGGITKYIGPTDVVVIKGNAQWPYQGYTHTGCIKAVIDEVLAIPGFSGEIIIADNIQNKSYSSSSCGFIAGTSYRTHNWPDHNWSTLAAEYQAYGQPVSIKRWENGPLSSGVLDDGITSPAEGEGWVRTFFTHDSTNIYLSYPVFESPLNAGRFIDMKNGIWEDGGYTGQKVKTIMMPTLNNHGSGGEDYAGVTSAIKCFFGCTEIHTGDNNTVIHNGSTYRHIHSATYTSGNACRAGELAAYYMNNLYRPALFITAAMWSGHYSRTGAATETKTVLACENPVTLDYVACRDVISPYASYLNPDDDNHTRDQILGCLSGGIGTIDTSEFQVIHHDFG